MAERPEDRRGRASERGVLRLGLAPSLRMTGVLTFAAGERARSGLHLYIVRFDYAALGTTRREVVDGLRGDIVALLTKDANAADVRNALVYTIRNDQNAGVRLKALDGLQQFISEDEVRGALTDVLASDVNPAMRIRAIDLLVQGLSERQDARQAQVVDRRMIGVLQELINRQEENPYMRERCLRALELVKASAELF